MKNIIIIILIVLGFYWLLDHHAPLPLNHDSLGLHEHSIHRIIGIVCFVIAFFLIWKWKMRKQAGDVKTDSL